MKEDVLANRHPCGRTHAQRKGHINSSARAAQAETPKDADDMTRTRRTRSVIIADQTLATNGKKRKTDGRGKKIPETPETSELNKKTLGTKGHQERSS